MGQLLHAGALRSKDILKPYVQVLLTQASGGTLTVQYYLADDSGKASATLTLAQAGQVKATDRVPEHPTSLNRPETQKLKLPHGLSLRGARVCIAATDPSGNRATSCKKA